MDIDQYWKLRKHVNRILLITPQGKITITDEGSRERKLAVPPLGLAYIAAQLLENGYDVEILDTLIEGFEHEYTCGESTLYGLTNSEIRNRIAAFSPDLVGVSCLFSNRINEALSICQIAKEVNSEIHVMLGGQHPSGLPNTILHPNVDYILKGESDLSVIQLIDTINNQGNLKVVDGIVFKTPQGIVNMPKMIFPDVNKLPRPAWNLLKLERYWDIGMVDYEIQTGERRRFMVVLTSRGCPHDCYFCTSKLNSGRKYRPRNVEDVLYEIQACRDTYGTEEIHFWDDNFFINKNRVKELLKGLIEYFPGMKFQVPSGSEVNSIDEEIIELMARAGFSKITLSIESADEDVQSKLVDKNVDIARIPQIVKKIQECGMIAGGSFMVGFPGETLEQVDTTFERASKLGFDRISIAIVNPLPGTGLWDICCQGGLFVDGFDISKIRWSQENLKLEGIPIGYLARRRREVWENYMKNKIDINAYETEAVNKDD